MGLKRVVLNAGSNVDELDQEKYLPLVYVLLFIAILTIIFN